MTHPTGDATPRTLPFTLADGTAGVLTGFDGREVLHSTVPRAYAPGAPVVFVLRGLGDTEVRIEARSLGTRRVGEGAFAFRARTTNLRREAREALTAHFAPATAPQDAPPASSDGPDR